MVLKTSTLDIISHFGMMWHLLSTAVRERNLCIAAKTKGTAQGSSEQRRRGKAWV